MIRNLYSDADGQALVSLGSPDRRRVTPRSYDDSTRHVGPADARLHRPRPAAAPGPRELRRRAVPPDARGRRCMLPDEAASGLRVRPPTGGHRAAILLTSPDSLTWTATPRVDARPYALSRDRVAARGGRVPGSITIVRPLDRHAQTSTGTHPAVATSCSRSPPGSVLRLHGGRSARWPTTLQKSVGSMPWRTIQTVRMPATGYLPVSHCSRTTRTLWDVLLPAGDGPVRVTAGEARWRGRLARGALQLLSASAHGRRAPGRTRRGTAPQPSRG